MIEKMRQGKMHFTLIDPDKQSPQKAGEMAKICSRYGSDAIMVGGSTAKREDIKECVEKIKNNCNLPVIIFPNSADSIVENADYIFFMEFMNSLLYEHFRGEQLRGGIIVKKIGLKPIPMGYMVISTSSKPTTVETKTMLDRVGENDHEKAVRYAAYAECMGMDCVYLDAGSNAEKPVPDEMIKEIRKFVKIPLIVGGGIKTPEQARKKIEAGANVIVTGTLAEEKIEKIKEIIEAIKSASPP
ncbi:MAG: geranylgeranylglyceryl/heptaprenylglyceryl phosphate synthase [Thermoplasmatales archaeon]|nr:geranylgeranylglyceryl/heptaprenylglyceryl phosphate synthase [Thermoplasmatales archaeon]